MAEANVKCIEDSVEKVLDIAEEVIELERRFVARLGILTTECFRSKAKDKDVKYIYNPLEYAANLHNQYIKKYCNSSKKVMFLGMNPGPYGMLQTGVPFGEIAAVRDFLHITGEVEKPEKFHEKRPVEGLNCNRSEVSGKRLWGLIKELTKDNPLAFFKHCFVYNYCPLALLSGSAVNITPADLKDDDQKTLNSICDEFLYETLKLYKVEIVVAIGKYAEKRVLQVLKNYNLTNIKVVTVQHPSPRNAGSRNWHENAKQFLIDNDLISYIE